VQLTFLSPRLYLQETQLSLTNRATHLCKCSCVADLLSMRPSPYDVLSCRILSFCIKGYMHKYRSKNGRLWNSALFEWEAWLTPRYTPLLDMCYDVTFVSSTTKDVRKNAFGAYPIGVGVPKSKPIHHMCYHVTFGSSASKSAYMNRRERPKLVNAGAPPPCGRHVTDSLEIRPSPRVLSCRIWSFWVKRYERY